MWLGAAGVSQAARLVGCLQCARCSLAVPYRSSDLATCVRHCGCAFVRVRGLQVCLRSPLVRIERSSLR
jgi:hypothetical protein